MNVKLFNLILRYIKCHGTYKYQCRLGASVFNNKQRWDEDKWRCECKKFIDKGICDKEFN